MKCECGYEFKEDKVYAECCVGGHIPPCKRCPKCFKYVKSDGSNKTGNLL